MSIMGDIWDAHQRKIGATPNPRNDSLEEIARELSLRYPIRMDAVYRSLVNLLYAFEVAVQAAAITGQDASVLMDYFIANAVKGIPNDPS